MFWVGLSAKLSTCENERPLSPTANSGSLLCHVEEKCTGISMYRTNLVKCVPLNEQGKLRYPNKKEISICMPHLENEIFELSPKIVFLLGGQVANAISQKYSITFEKLHEFDYTAQNLMAFILFRFIIHPTFMFLSVSESGSILIALEALLINRCRPSPDPLKFIMLGTSCGYDCWVRRIGWPPHDSVGVAAFLCYFTLSFPALKHRTA